MLSNLNGNVQNKALFLSLVVGGPVGSLISVRITALGKAGPVAHYLLRKLPVILNEFAAGKEMEYIRKPSSLVAAEISSPIIRTRYI